MLPKALAGQTLEAVPIDCPADLTLGNREPQTGHLDFVGSGQNGQVAVGGLDGPLKNALVIACGQQPTAFREAVTSPLQARARQTVSCFRPLALRALMTRRPPRVFIRARKPWVRTRLILLG